MTSVIYVNDIEFVNHDKDLELTMLKLLFNCSRVRKLTSITLEFSGKNLTNLLFAASDELKTLNDINIGEVYDSGLATISEAHSTARCIAMVANFVVMITMAMQDSKTLTVTIRKPEL